MSHKTGVNITTIKDAPFTALSKEDEPFSPPIKTIDIKYTLFGKKSNHCRKTFYDCTYLHRRELFIRFGVSMILMPKPSRPAASLAGFVNGTNSSRE